MLENIICDLFVWIFPKLWKQKLIENLIEMDRIMDEKWSRIE